MNVSYIILLETTHHLKDMIFRIYKTIPLHKSNIFLIQNVCSLNLTNIPLKIKYTN